MDDYQTNISKTVEILTETKDKLIQKVFDLAITGELKEWSDTIDVGEHFYFSRELFESLGDTAIHKLLTLIGKIENVIEDFETMP